MKGPRQFTWCLARAVVCLTLGSWLLYLARWVVTSSVSGERDSSPLVYVVYGAYLWLPGLLLVGLGLLAAVRARSSE